MNPRDGEKVMGWLSDPVTAIYDWPAIIWQVDGRWWSGVPGTYINLDELEWTVARWEPLAAPDQAIPAERKDKQP